MAVVTASAVAATGAIGSAVIGSKASDRASRRQADAAREGNALLDRQYQEARSDLAPYREGGNRAFQEMLNQLGLGDEPVEEYGGFRETPGYQFAFDEGMRSLSGAASAAGMLESGRHMKDAIRYGTGMAEQEYNNYYNRLGGVAQTGLNATSATTTAGLNYGNQAATGLQRAGDAEAAGAIGRAQAITDGIGGTVGAIGTYLGGRNRGTTAPPIASPAGGWTYTPDDIDWGIFGRP